jgi:thioredoxin 1
LRYSAEVSNKQTKARLQTAQSDAPWVVALCADWCSQCRGYRKVFEGVASEFPAARFFWVDVEDDEDIAGELDIETFPTVLVADHGLLKFFGPLTTQPGVLQRLLQSRLGPQTVALEHEAGTRELVSSLQTDSARLRSLEIDRN